MSILAEVQALDALGFNILPAKYQGKAPIVDWRKYQNKRSSGQLTAWFRNGRYNAWMNTGSISGVVVLDIDSDEAEAFWRETLGDEMLDTTACVRTGSGKHHYWFRLAEDDDCPSWSKHDRDGSGIDFDVRGDITGVIVPPSIHENGHPYEWVRGPECMLPVPQAIRRKGTGSGPVSQDEEGHRPAVRSLLAELLAHPPAEGGRNDWLTRVAGHMARMVPYEDAFRQMAVALNRGLDEPLDDAEVTKITDSIWSTEQRQDRDTQPTEENGWLQGHRGKLHTLCKRGSGEDAEIYAAPWSDFDIHVVGVIEANDERSYQVEIIRGEERRRDLLEPGTLGRTAELNVWLARHGATILPPSNEMHRGSASARLQRYIEAQDAPTATAVDHLGWHPEIGGFVTHEGIINDDGLEPHGSIIPHPRVKEWAPFRYGFVSETKARSVLADVLEFHEPQVTAVFGAWWAACVLKAQIMEQTALFPFMALEAPSESGKTTGFFQLMMQLNGNTGGHGEYTIPYLRDMASAHRNGVVWIDDMSDVSAVLDLIRQATSEGSRGKKGMDRTKQETVRLLAPIAVSGEGLGALEFEKALIDRAVRLAVGSPKGRMSAKDPSRPQWDDIRDLQSEWDGDLTQMAGTLIQMALGQIGQVSRLRELRGGSGRHADKVAILRVGARILAGMLDHDEDESWIVTEVDRWCTESPDMGAENVLTTMILPRLLLELGMPSSPSGFSPVYVDRGIVWFNEPQVAAKWQGMASTPRERQLGTEASLRLQRQALGVEGNGTRKTWTAAGRRQFKRYQALPAEVSRLVIERTSMDEGPDEGSLL